MRIFSIGNKEATSQDFDLHVDKFRRLYMRTRPGINLKNIHNSYIPRGLLEKFEYLAGHLAVFQIFSVTSDTLSVTLLSVSSQLVLNWHLHRLECIMGHLLKTKCVDSRVNVIILASTSVPFTLTTVQGPNLALTHTKRITEYLTQRLISYQSLNAYIFFINSRQ
jgi:hypothetical protein